MLQPRATTKPGRGIGAEHVTIPLSLLAFLLFVVTAPRAPSAQDGIAAPLSHAPFKTSQRNKPVIFAETDARLMNKIRGLVVPRHHATISSRLQATISAIGPDNGERFKKGDKLVAFDCAIYKAELQRAEAQLSAARDTQSVKSELASNGTISKLQLVLANADFKKAEAERVLSRERVAHCAITAPYAGRIVRRIANAHETVKFGAPLMEIVNDRDIELQLYVPSKWLGQLKIGTEFRFRVDETQDEIRAEIIAIGAWIDNVSQLIEIRAISPGATHRLLSGMSGHAEFEHIK